MIKPRSKECFGVSRHVDEPEDRKPPIYDDVTIEPQGSQKLFLELIDSLQKDIKDSSTKLKVDKVIRLNRTLALLTESYSEFLSQST